MSKKMSYKRIYAVAKREYLSVVKKKSFWISTFLFPIFMLVISFVSGYSAQQAELAMNDIKNFKDVNILVMDETNIINDKILKSGNIEKVDNKREAIKRVQSKASTVLLYYPQSLTKGDGEIEVYKTHESLIENGNYNSLAIILLKNSVLLNLSPAQIKVATTDPEIEVIAYENGKKIDNQFTRFVVPALAIFLYFIMVTFGMNYFLSSMSEEKESRMMEIILTSISSKALLVGKFLGLISVILTQLLLLISFGIIAFQLGEAQLPFTIGKLIIDPFQLVYAITVMFLGFTILANLMIGIASAMPNLKEAQSFSSVFILASMLPLYLAGILVNDPNGTIAMILSYTPISAPLILLFRNALNVLTWYEMVISIVALLLQFGISLYLAIRLFKLGSLEYKNKISFRKLL